MDNIADVAVRAQTNPVTEPILPAPTTPQPVNGTNQPGAAGEAPKPETTKPSEVAAGITAPTPRTKPKPEVVDYKELWKPLPIGQIIMADYDYIVFLATNDLLDWQTMPSIDAEIAKLPKTEVSAVHNRATEVFAMPKEHLTADQKLNIRKMVGEGYARLFDLDPKSALEMMNTAGAYASARNQEIARGWQLTGTVWAAIVFCAVGCVAWLFRSLLRQGLGELPFVLLVGFCAGAVGALFSVLTRLGTNSLDPSAGERLHVLEGRARVAAGAIGSVFAILAVHLSLILGVLTKFGNPALIFIALVAGASERLVPTIIKRTEDDAASSGKGGATQ
jgi:hypothetical protein